jgi:hypothetical protein
MECNLPIAKDHGDTAVARKQIANFPKENLYDDRYL